MRRRTDRTRSVTRPGSGTHARTAGAALAVGVLAVGVLAAGCGSAVRPAAAPGPRPVSLPLATSLGSGQATWAVVPMGAPAGPNLFWQLFLLPAPGGHWQLATPPDVATNGAIALGTEAGQALVTGIHPSLLLDYSPVTSTPDGGRSWTAGPPDAGLANVPDALGTAPHRGELIALDRDGDARLARSGQTSWTTLTSTKALAGRPAARACGLVSLTAAAFDPSGSPVLAGSCGRAGEAGIFADQGGSWHPAGPALPAALRGQRIRVLRLVRTGGRLTALLQAGTGRASSVLTAWSGTSPAAGGKPAGWSVSRPLPVSGAAVLSSSFGDAGAAAVELTGGRGEFLAGPGASWQPLPALPAGRSVTLALPGAGGAGGVDALAADGSILTAWRLQPPRKGSTGPATWDKAQQIRVPIQYGSSS